MKISDLWVAFLTIFYDGLRQIDRLQGYSANTITIVYLKFELNGADLFIEVGFGWLAK